jgi:hypothetical protein
MRVFVNSQPINTIRLSLDTAEENSLTRSRSVIVSLNVGDQLHVTMLTADGNYFTAHFTGIRLF